MTPMLESGPRLLALSLLLLALLPVAPARAQHVEGIEIVEWGIYRTDNVGQIASPSSRLRA